jgi:hypothetical protein
LETVRATYEQREATIRAEYEGRVYLTPAQQQARIDQALEPLRKEIKKYEEKLAKFKERDDARARNAPPPAADKQSEPPQAQKEPRSPADAAETRSKNDPNLSGDQAETRSTENAHETKDEVDGAPIAPAEDPGPPELDRSISATDAADEEALCAVKAAWCQASARGRERIGAFVIKATVEQRSKADKGRPVLQPTS